MVYGFIRYSLAPAMSARATLGGAVSLVTITTSISSKRWSARTCFTNSRPFMTGMFQSTSATFGGGSLPFRRSSASLPFSASSTWKPLEFKARASLSRAVRESSTTSASISVLLRGVGVAHEPVDDRVGVYDEKQSLLQLAHPGHGATGLLVQRLRRGLQRVLADVLDV